MSRRSTGYDERKIETFDDFDSSENGTDYGELTPMQFLDKDTDILEWLNQMYDLQIEINHSRFRAYKKNMYLYKGIHWRGEDDTKRAPKQSVNFVYELTEAKVSNYATNKVNFVAIPKHNEQTDVNDARAAKMLLDSRCKEIDFDGLNTDFDRTMLQLGHAFFHIPWSKTAGGLHPSMNRVAEMGPKMLEKAQKMVGSKDAIFIGDVDVEVLGANRVFGEPGKKILNKDMNYVDIVEMVHIEELKGRYPKLAEDIGESDDSDFEWELDDDNFKTGFAVKHTTYHRSTKYMPAGRRIVWTRDAILEDGPLGYKHGLIPLVDDRDISIKDEFHGRSCYSNIYSLQRFYNLIQSYQARDFAIAGSPKWMIRKGSIKPTAINSDLSIMEWTGPSEPKLQSHSPSSSQGFELQDRLERKMTKMMAVYDMSRGEMPPGVTANSALRFVDEQEVKRLTTAIAGRNKRITKALGMMMSTMGQFYKLEDGRTIRTVGADNEYLIKNLSKTDFTKIHSIELQKTSSLPDSKTGKIGTIIDLNQVTQTDPVFKRDEIIDMLDLGLDKAFVNRATVGINAARSILQDILEGKDVPEPREYDSLTIHYGVLCDALEENWFKQRVDENVQKVIADRVLTLEGLMYMRATKNLAFAQEVMTLDKYPIFFNPTVPIHMIVMQMQMMPETQAPATPTDKITTINKGE